MKSSNVFIKGGHKGRGGFKTKDPVVMQGDVCQPNNIDPNSIDLTITSPPYNLGKDYTGYEDEDAMNYETDYLNFTKKWLANCYLWSKNSARLCVNVAIDISKFGKKPLMADVIKMAQLVGWNYQRTIIWKKTNLKSRLMWGSFKSASAPHIHNPSEVIVVFYKKLWKRERTGQRDITAEELSKWEALTWTFKEESSKRVGHPAPFPRELPKRCIKLFSCVGDRVLDPFCGSGTTLIEAVVNQRQAVGIEKSGEYCHLALQRLQDEAQLKFF